MEMTVTKEIFKRSFWALPIGEVLEILETARGGLTGDEAKERISTFGKNSLPKESRLSRARIFLRQFKSPLLALLLMAAGVTIFLKDYKSAGVILVTVMANIILGFYQENKAEAALAHLKTYTRERTQVFRNGQEIETDAEKLVPGDIIHLAQGDRVPADCRLIYLNDFMVDEAILTGESLPVAKTTEPAGFKAVLADRHSMVYSGTLVVQGFANAVVCATGPETELGKIAHLVAQTEKEKTPLQKAITRFSLKTSVIILTLTIIVFFLGILTGRPPLEMFLIAVAIAVAAVPEGLPVALTVILAIGVQRLAKKNGIVRKLLAAETLGNTSVILTDKTGTLTQAKMALSQVKLFDKSSTQDKIIRFALLNTEVIVENPRDNCEKWRVLGRPLEVALVKAAAKLGILLPVVKKETEVLDYLPFTSKNKYSASLLKDGPNYSFLLNVFGAPEILLKNSELADAEKHRILKEIDEMAYSGERVLGLAVKEIKSSTEVSLRDRRTFQGLKFLGTVSFQDPIRPGAREAIARVARAGVETVIVTGDHRGTAEAVAKELGIKFDRDQVIEGAELDVFSDENLKKTLPILKIVARVSPEGKLRIAKGFRELGEVVAMTGDGINDAASLKEADIGVAMGSGTDVAKDVSDLVLLDDNFATIVAAIEEGRRILENIRKVIIFLFASVFDGLLLIGSTLVLGLTLPINALQILFVNFFANSFPALGLAFENHVDYLSQKRRKRALNLFDKEMTFLVLTVGLPTGLLLSGLYYLLIAGGFEPELVRTFIFASFASYSLFMIFSIRSLRQPVWTHNPFSNPFILFGVILGLVAIAAVVYLPVLQELLGTTSLPPIWLAAVAVFGAANLLAIEAGKSIIRRWRLNGD
jgi:Ca2+-transporting ATPase